MIDTRTDAIVIGAGFIGSSVAAHLRWRGLSVRLLERDRIGDGTSSRGGGWVAAQGRQPNSHLVLALASLAYWPEFLARLGDDCGYLRCGSLVLFESEQQLERRRLFLAEQLKVPGYDGFEFLDGRQVRELEPQIADQIIGASYRRGDGQIDPMRLIHGIVTAARRDGVQVHQGARVTAIESDGAGWRVQTPIGDFTADAVVNAAGVWSPEIASLVGVELPVMPIAGQMCTTAPRPPFVRSVVAVQIDTRRTTQPACDVRQGYDGRIWLGTTNRPNSSDTTVTETDTQTIRAGVARVFPALKDVVIEHAWAGIRPVPVDLLPIYGGMEERPGLYIAVPLAGICETAIAGKAMAELIASGTSGTPLDAFLPRRFNATPLAV